MRWLSRVYRDLNDYIKLEQSGRSDAFSMIPDTTPSDMIGETKKFFVKTIDDLQDKLKSVSVHNRRYPEAHDSVMLAMESMDRNNGIPDMRILSESIAKVKEAVFNDIESKFERTTPYGDVFRHYRVGENTIDVYRHFGRRIGLAWPKSSREAARNVSVPLL